MNRSIIYTQEQPRTFDVLWGWRDALIAAGYLEQDLTGATTTVVSGFGASASSPASLILNLAAGRVYEQAEVDGTQYGSIPSDTDLVMQQGFGAAQTVTLTGAALSAGHSQWVLIEAAFGQVDVIRANDPTGGVLYYWNSANPTVPFQGPNGNGQTQPSEREGVASIQIVYGTPAATGSEVPPAASGGSVGLYLIDLAFGQTAITQGEILVAGPSVGVNVPSNYPYAPFLAGLLNQHHTGKGNGQAPQIDLTAEVKNKLPLANLPATSTYAGLIPVVQQSAGNPNGSVAGNASSSAGGPDLCYDTANDTLYACTVTGTTSTAAWQNTGTPRPPTYTVLNSGSGNYTPPAGVSQIIVSMIGPGGSTGGAGSGTSGGGGNGTPTSFNGYIASAGEPSSGYNTPALGNDYPLSLGGANILGSGATVLRNQCGSSGGVPQVTPNGVGYDLPAAGAPGPFGGPGPNGTNENAFANSGAGAGGALGSISAVSWGSFGGASGGFLQFVINAPTGPYAYVVGTAGAPGAAGSGGNSGFTGGSGQILIEERYGG